MDPTVLLHILGLPITGVIASNLWITVMVIMATVMSPLILAYYTNRSRRQEKREDYERARLEKQEDYRRQDAVAAQAAEAARLLLEKQDSIAERAAETARSLAASNKIVAEQAAEAASLLASRQDAAAAKAAEAARLLLAANERVAATSVVTNNKLDVIHTLVNSNMTAAMQAELDATIRELAMMQEVIDLKQASSGRPPGVEALAAIASTKLKIGELRAILKDRSTQFDLIKRDHPEMGGALTSVDR